MTRARTFFSQLTATREERLFIIFLIVVTGAIACVNAFTVIVDAERAGGSVDPRLPWLYEISSAVALVVLYPLLLTAVRRMPMTTRNWKSHLPLYLVFSVLFSAAHVTGMVAIRKVVLWLFLDGTYIFFGDIFRESAYEYRKDLVSFAMVVALAHIIQAKVKAPSGQKPRRLQLKSGSQTILINPDDFSFAKTAGNYIELSLGSGETHLIRMSLAAFQETLTEAGANVTRIHRSYLVKTSLVAEVTPKGDGDAELRLTDGTVLPVSRRYRKQLAAAL
ncbi:LytR/AlgR family response regulator transcription factor [Kordiimonas sp.]|uniref:LytR/AlgR family response regulator transcription factor n=1 Tax=Kordiimonas sp. TaxID=1970157 RepID=UPI003A927D65